MRKGKRKTPVMECVGCGYCCLKAPCAIGAHFHRIKPGDRCPSLRWLEAERRYVCRLPFRDRKYYDLLGIGEGCSSSLNDWRKDVKERG